MRARLRLAIVAILVAVPSLYPGVGQVAAASPDDAPVLPGSALAALVADVDADGENEVVRLVDEPGPGFTIEVWRLSPGGWEAVGTTALNVTGRGAEVAIANEVGALLAWRSEGVMRVLAIAGAGDPDRISGTCCLTIHHVVAASNGGLRLVPMPAPDVAALEVRALDLDGDGTDELALLAQAPGGDHEAHEIELAIMRWDGHGWAEIHRSLVASEFGNLHTGAAAGGDMGDVLLGGPTGNGDLLRIGGGPAGVVVETDHVDIGPQFDGWLQSATHELLMLTSASGLGMIEWPRDGRPTIGARHVGSAYAVGLLLPDADDVFVLSFDGGFGARSPGGPIEVHDRALEPVVEVVMPQTGRTLWELAFSDRALATFEHGIYPYLGPLPGTIDGRPAVAAAGVLLLPDGAGGVDSALMAPIIGLTPLGRVGPDDAWIALGNSFAGSGSIAYLFAMGDFPPIPGGSPEGRVVATRVDRLLDPAVTPPGISVLGAVETGRSDDEIRVVASQDPFTLEIRADPGSVLMSADASVIETSELTQGRSRIEVRPRRRAVGGVVEHWIGIFEPDGRGSITRVVATVLADPPTVTADADVGLFASRATITGTVSEATTVTVNGAQPFMLGARRYRAIVDAPIWPTDVTIVARDPFGRETVTRVQVVGFIDYRGLPWVAIVGAGILAAGAFLFLRTPMRREPMPVAWGDGTFEEVDGD